MMIDDCWLFYVMWLIQFIFRVITYLRNVVIHNDVYKTDVFLFKAPIDEYLVT